MWGWLRTVLLMLPLLAATQAQALTAKDINVEKFIDVGAGQVRWQQGALYSNGNGYVATTNGVYNSSMFDLSDAVLAQVSDKMVMQLSLWLGLESIPRYSLKNFSRSQQTYQINQVDYVIVNLKGVDSSIPVGSQADTLRLSLSGTSYCTGSKPQKLTAKTAPALWLKLNSANEAVLYGDAGITAPLAVLALDTVSITGKMASFTAWYAADDSYLSLVGTFAIDSSGAVKSVKASLLQRKIIGDCYASAQVKGKR